MHFSIRGAIISAMQEVLSNAVEGKTPLEEQEFYELSLLDTPNQLGTQYSVRQGHALWSEIDRQIMWDDEQVEYFWIPEEAQKRYSERRLALADKGLIYSDMDW